jgi:hypothetical protein
MILALRQGGSLIGEFPPLKPSATMERKPGCGLRMILIVPGGTIAGVMTFTLVLRFAGLL